MKYPSKIQKGDRVAIISPASAVKEEYIDGASRFLTSAGFEPVVMPHAKGPCSGSYAATDDERLSDLESAYRDPTVRAILCARGGYGCNHLISRIEPSLIANNPKWLIGFSDVSALHALSLHAGVVSLHAPMAKHLTLLPADHYCTRTMMEILESGLPYEYHITGNRLNRPGSARGRLVGGNLAVINGLAATPFDPVATAEPIILFIEDIGEQIYEVERMLIRMRLAGQLDRLAGLIIGNFTDYREDRNHKDMYSMIDSLLSAGRGVEFPVAYGFPTGHTDDNLPLPLGCETTIEVSRDCVRLLME